MNANNLELTYGIHLRAVERGAYRAYYPFWLKFSDSVTYTFLVVVLV